MCLSSLPQLPNYHPIISEHPQQWRISIANQRNDFLMLFIREITMKQPKPCLLNSHVHSELAQLGETSRFVIFAMFPQFLLCVITVCWFGNISVRIVAEKGQHHNQIKVRPAISQWFLS